MKGQYASGTDEGSVECFEREYTPVVVVGERMLEALDAIKMEQFAHLVGVRPGTTGWVRSNGYSKGTPHTVLQSR